MNSTAILCLKQVRFSSSQSPGEYHIIYVIDKFTMDAECPFELRKSSCGDFLGSPFAVRRLLEYKNYITGHLQSCHISKLVGNVEEHDLILLMKKVKHLL